MDDSTLSSEGVVIERLIEAPVDLIWRMWTDPEHFRNWYGPTGFSVLVAEMDVRVGGRHLICMETERGGVSFKMWSTGEYLEIVPDKRLVYTDSLADEHGNVVPASDYGMEGNHPGTTKVTVELEDLGGKTKMTVVHEGVPSETGANQGWAQAFDKLEAYAATL